MTCPDCAGTGTIDLAAELAEARRYLAPTGERKE